MFENNTFSTYTGGDAFGEIFIMLLVAFIIGWFARMIWDQIFGYEYEIEDFEEYDETSQLPLVEEEILETPLVEKTEEKVALSISPNGLANDDLKIVEGIGPKIEALLKRNGVDTWQDLASKKPEELKGILSGSGDRFSFHDPSTWAEQAMLAVNGEWDELEKFQDFLNGGKYR